MIPKHDMVAADPLVLLPKASLQSGGGVISFYSSTNLSLFSSDFFTPRQSSPRPYSPGPVELHYTTTLIHVQPIPPSTMSEINTPKKEKKDKKRKSDAAGLAEIAPVAPEAGSASAEAIAIEVDGEKALKKAKKDKKEKRKSVAAEGAEGDVKVCSDSTRIDRLVFRYNDKY